MVLTITKEVTEERMGQGPKQKPAWITFQRHYAHELYIDFKTPNQGIYLTREEVDLLYAFLTTIKANSV